MSSLSASTIILEYVCPTLGMIVANQMFYAPYQDVKKSIARGFLGDLNPLPWAVMLGNCCGWVTYGILRNNYFIFFANAPGFLLALWFNLAASKLLFQQQFTNTNKLPSLPLEETASTITAETPLLVPVGDNVATMDSPNKLEPPKEAPPPSPTTITSTVLDDPVTPVPVVVPYHPPQHDYWVMCMTAFWVAIISIVGFGKNLTDDTRQMIVGLTVNANLVFFYGAPLSTIATVLRERNTASLHVPTMLTNTANGVFWFAYGLAVIDWFVIIPNGLGALLGCIQFFLYLTFPRATTEQAIILDKSTNDEEEVVVFHKGDKMSPTTTATFASGETTMTMTLEPSSIDNFGVSQPFATLSEAKQSKEEPRYTGSSIEVEC